MKTIYSDYQSYRPALNKIVVFEFGDLEASGFQGMEIPDWGTRPEYDPTVKMASGFGVDKRAYFAGWVDTHDDGADYTHEPLGWLSEDEIAKLESVPMWLWLRRDVSSIKMMLKPSRNGYDKMVFWSKYAELLDNLPDIPVDGLANYRIVDQ